ncbi:MAG: phosphoenolpyruvate carboxylase [Spirochaetales bacterium]|nr:phosphoenolpyruvate carboxylase [Spirochaetales bacterium]
MAEHRVYREEVDLKYQIFNGLFLSLPFQHVRRAGILLPVFVERARRLLADGTDPVEIVDSFFDDQLVEYSPEDRIAILFRFVQLVERQVVLFDALEDAAFPHVHDMEGVGTLNETLARIIQAERRADLERIVSEFRVRIVLTAHPTQFYPSRVLGIITDLIDALAKNDISRIYNYLLQLGKTRFGNRRKPTPMDEARSLLWYLENVFYHTFPGVHARIATESRPTIREALDLDPIVEVGFWPGGDRDGNPFVDAKTTREVASTLRTSVLSLYLADIETLARRLTFDGAIDRITSIRSRLRSTLRRHCEDSDAPPFESAAKLKEALVELRQHLHDKHDGLFAEPLESLIWRVEVFGFHFATLDIRQDSRIHGRVVGAVIGGDGELSLERITRVVTEGALPAYGEAEQMVADEAVLLDTIQSIRVAREIQGDGGERALHRYIISNTRGAADVMAVFLLARIAGYPEGGVDLDIVPLFETVDDLRSAPEIMQTLYELPLYRAHLERRGETQQIMLGFSDGTKDGGYVTANWLIYRAREDLTACAARYGINVVFFEGRGGPPARGGGKTHQFYRAMSRLTARNQIHLTIQGQTISSNFGTVDAARFNLEQLVTAGLENLILSDDYQDLTDEQRGLIDTMSAHSLESYRSLKRHPQFIPYLERMTPLVYYGQANNASRPTSRGRTDSLRLEDLRAIPFVGAWSQMKQNVPGYFGFGSALGRLIATGHLEDLRRLYRCHLFFRTLVENSMQSLSKVSFDLTRFISKDGQFSQIWDVLEEEATKTRNMLLQIADAERLLPNDPSLQASIALRESIILPVLVIQQYALARIRDGVDEHEAGSLKKLVVKSMAAIVNAGRNSV